MFRQYKHIHFVGIGGSGMSGIAEVLVNMGFRVTGSDIKETETTQRLRRLGARIQIGHHSAHVNGAHVVVTSSAVRGDNSEVERARLLNIAVIPRAEMLAELMRLKYSVAIAGCHGKTTTTSMAAQVLVAAGLDPTVVIGGRFNNLGSGAKLGKGEYLVAEADESDGSFLKYNPTFCVVTNIDNDHLDHYGTLENIRQAFLEFVNKISFYGAAFLCSDDKNTRRILKNIHRRFYTYGLSAPADFQAVEIMPVAYGSRFAMMKGATRLGEIRLSVPGRHNIQNALAAASLGVELGIDFKKIARALAGYRGVRRRLEVKGEVRGVLFVDDYGHHPTEIKATLEAVKASWPNRRIVALFQPHRYSRTRFLHKEFGGAFARAKKIGLFEIYPAGETPLKGVSSHLICEALRKNGKSATALASPQRLGDFYRQLTSGDVVVTLGAGDVWKAADVLMEQLRKTR